MSIFRKPLMIILNSFVNLWRITNKTKSYRRNFPNFNSTILCFFLLHLIYRTRQNCERSAMDGIVLSDTVRVHEHQLPCSYRTSFLGVWVFPYTFCIFSIDGGRRVFYSRITCLAHVTYITLPFLSQDINFLFVGLINKEKLLQIPLK